MAENFARPFTKGFGVFVSLTLFASSARAETIHYLPAKDLNQFRISLSQGEDRTNPAGVFELDATGVLKISGATKGFLITKRTFTNYTLVAEYRWKTASSDRDSGVFVNAVPKGRRFTALECDLPKPAVGQSGRVWLYGVPPQGITGAGNKITTGGAAPKQKQSLERPIGEWNVMEVTFRNNRLQIKLNGQITVEGANPIPRSGAVMLQSSDGGAEFRKLDVTIPEAEKSAAKIEVPGKTAPQNSRATIPAARNSTPARPASKLPTNPDAFARKGLWAEAAKASARLAQEDPARAVTIDGLKLALLYAATGNREAHAKHCRIMLKTVSSWKSPGDGGRPAKSWAALPDAIDDGLRERARAGAAHATKDPNHPASGWFSLTRGMVEFRCGSYREALLWLQKTPEKKNPAMHAAAEAFAAMAAHRLGNESQADQSLGKAQSAFREIPRPSRDDLGPQWYNHLAAKLAIDEAKALINGK